jgi:hypothetical protein
MRQNGFYRQLAWQDKRQTAIPLITSIQQETPSFCWAFMIIPPYRFHVIMVIQNCIFVNSFFQKKFSQPLKNHLNKVSQASPNAYMLEGVHHGQRCTPPVLSALIHVTMYLSIRRGSGYPSPFTFFALVYVCLFVLDGVFYLNVTWDPVLFALIHLMLIVSYLPGAQRQVSLSPVFFNRIYLYKPNQALNKHKQLVEKVLDAYRTFPHAEITKEQKEVYHENRYRETI